jgi:hypothetical protein
MNNGMFIESEEEESESMEIVEEINSIHSDIENGGIRSLR